MTDPGSHFQGGNSERYILGSIHRLPGNLRVFHNPSVCKIVLNKHLDVKTRCQDICNSDTMGICGWSGGAVWGGQEVLPDGAWAWARGSEVCCGKSLFCDGEFPGTPYLSRRSLFTSSSFHLLWTRRLPPQGAAQTLFEPNDETLTPQRPARAFMFF